MDIEENKSFLKKFPAQIPTPSGLSVSDIRGYIIKESIALASLVDNSSIILSEEEEDKIKEDGMFLFYALSLLPKKVEFFWRIVSLHSYIKREILKARSFFTYSQPFGTESFPFPFFIDEEFLKDFHFVLNQASKTISSETKRRKIVDGAKDIFIFLERMQEKTYSPFWDIVDGEEQDTEKNYLKATSSYETNLKFLMMSENKITSFLNFSNIDGTIRKISSKIFENISAKNSLDIFRLIEAIKEEGVSYYSGIPKGAKSKIYAQANFGGSFLQDSESILAISPSDFMLHFLVEQKEERIRKMNIFFLYQLIKIHKSEEDIKKNIEIDTTNNSFALKDAKIQNQLLGDEYKRLKRIKTLQDVLQGGVTSFYRKVEKATKIKVFEYLDIDTNEVEDIKAFLNKDFSERTIDLFQFIKESVYENRRFMPSSETEFYRKLEEDMLSDVISKLMTEVSLSHKAKEKELVDILSRHKETAINPEPASVSPENIDASESTIEDEKAIEELKEESVAKDDSGKLFSDFELEYANEDEDSEYDNDECFYEDE